MFSGQIIHHGARLYQLCRSASPGLTVFCGTQSVNKQNQQRFFKCESKLYHNLESSQNFQTYHCLKPPSRHISSLQVTPVFLRAKAFKDKLAFVSQHGKYAYNDILEYSLKLSNEIQNNVNNNMNIETKHSALPLLGERIAFLCENDMSYLITLWAVWMNGAIAVPLCKSHPESELQYFVSDSQSCLILATDDFSSKVKGISQTLGIPLMLLSQDDYGGDYDEEDNSSISQKGLDKHDMLERYLQQDTFRDLKAMIIYTSGTTGRPKGVVYTHGNIHAQIQGMVEAWQWTSDDVILHVLPLHHVHGVVNILLTPLYCGATCVMVPKFDAASTWKMLLSENHHPAINMFMAVPAIYAKLIEEYESHKSAALFENMKDVLSRKIRLMVSGSAALPMPVMEKWREITGHTLLERYGMTEIGMALTNPLIGDRQPGAVGIPFPGVSVCIADHHEDGYDILASADSQTRTVTPGKEEEQGELLVKGDNVFKEYWKKEEATKESFTHDGWFKTGDTAVFKDGAFRIVGRTSVDVLKSGGYKISALEVERHLLAHPAIKDIAVIGLPDEMWGQRITAVVVVRDGQYLSLSELKEWAADKMAPYHVPTVLKRLEEMPRNAMGKVNKKQLAKDLFPEYFK